MAVEFKEPKELNGRCFRVAISKSYARVNKSIGKSLQYTAVMRIPGKKLEIVNDKLPSSRFIDNKDKMEEVSQEEFGHTFEDTKVRLTDCYNFFKTVGFRYGEEVFYYDETEHFEGNNLRFVYGISDNREELVLADLKTNRMLYLYWPSENEAGFDTAVMFKSRIQICTFTTMSMYKVPDDIEEELNRIMKELDDVKERVSE